jgi:hypothetical protein
LLRLAPGAILTATTGARTMMDWFERLMGFREGGYAETRGRLQVDGRQLRSLVNGHGYGIGDLELVPLQTLRERVLAVGKAPGRLRVGNVSGDVRAMHCQPENEGALFQVASQFNLLEMVSPEVTPEDGVTGYQHDRTQGPACAMAAGAGTIYRNYFAPVGAGPDQALGQTRERQLDGLADIGAALASALGRPTSALWDMRNGYALCTRDGLAAITAHLDALPADKTDALRGLLRIGIQQDVDVTDSVGPRRPAVSQAYCSALPVAYSRLPAALWRSFAQFVLEAAYEATMCAAVLNARRGASNVVLLTRLGGGAFGNDDSWIDAAMRRALTKATGFDLDVRLVSYGAPPMSMVGLAVAFQ